MERFNIIIYCPSLTQQVADARAVASMYPPIHLRPSSTLPNCIICSIELEETDLKNKSQGGETSNQVKDPFQTCFYCLRTNLCERLCSPRLQFLARFLVKHFLIFS